VTLATNDSYSLGALVVGHSLRRVGTPHDLVVLVTPGVSAAMRYVQIITSVIICCIFNSPKRLCSVLGFSVEL
jgi:hypothetical protein